ncbi:MAG: macrolide ABC transporter ATP-binding protein [Sulfurovum sp. FS08-3]|nr:MAG: macrolide ABC transporter ATP-binding protein [Sulfurovum sp. FS08-3]
MSSTTPLICLKAIKKSYGEGEAKTYALRGVDVEFFEGEFVAIMGSSGSGKSTMMNIIGCLDYPTQGEYFFEGVNVATLNRNQISLLRRNFMGFIFQGFNLLARTSALENVELPLIYRGMKAAQRRAKSLEALDRVGLSHVAHHQPSQLSGGQQQRVAIARALVTQPLIILADEPTGNLDTQNSLEVMKLLQKLNCEGITIIMVTHEPDMAQFAQKSVMFKDGCIEKIVENPHAS